MNNPKISIITPVKNAEKWIRECAQSILRQSYMEWEWIIVNDHSSDKTGQIIESFPDSRISLIENDGSGIIESLVTGYKHCSGQFITRMDADDVLSPNRLKVMSEALNKAPKHTLVTGLVRYFSDKPISEGYKTYENWLNKINLSGNQWQNIYRECVVASPNWMIRRNDLDDIQGFNKLEYPEDYDLTFRWYKHGFKITTIPEVTLEWREHNERTSRVSLHYQQKAFFDLKIKRFLEIDHNGQPIVIWGRNIKSKLTSDILTEKGVPFIIQDTSDYQSLEDFTNSQLLVAVYPSENQRTSIENFLSSINRIEGANWWYL
ncbi:MAG: glycosyltransferase family A protein [Marinoscillum sp.]